MIVYNGICLLRGSYLGGGAGGGRSEGAPRGAHNYT